MKALVYHGNHDLRIQNVPYPEMGLSDAILKIDYCGICATDVEEYVYGPKFIFHDYPNPITDGRTTFRFFVANDVGNIQVRIYDAAGFLVKDDLELINPIVNEFNEIEWQNIEVNAGLYLAEIKQDSGKSELVKLVVIR